jgi:hypothetical protein
MKLLTPPRRAALGVIKNGLKMLLGGGDAAPSGPAGAPALGDDAPQCLVGFFGLNRALPLTFPSIQANVLDAVRAAGLRPVVVAHFNDPAFIHSPRSGEKHVTVKMDGLNLLGAELCWVEPQRDSNIAKHVADVMKLPLVGDRDVETTIRRNSMHQLYSLARLLALAKMAGLHRFGAVCVMRADMKYLDPLPAGTLTRIKNGEVDIVTPSWGKYGGANDRFALCSPQGAEVYLGRLALIERYSQEKDGNYHSEEFLEYVLRQSGLRLEVMPTRAQLVRSTGAVWDEDFSS